MDLHESHNNIKIQDLQQQLHMLLTKLKQAKQYRHRGCDKHFGETVYEHIMLVLGHRSIKSLKMFWAALLHDIGKVDAYEFDQARGKATFYEHEIHSACFVSDIADLMLFSGLSSRELLDVIHLCENHMRMKLFWEMRAHKKLLFQQRNKHIWNELVLLSEVDDMTPFMQLYGHPLQTLKAGKNTRLDSNVVQQALTRYQQGQKKLRALNERLLDGIRHAQDKANSKPPGEQS